MDRIRIRNLRCLSDTDFIEIKPITILVGANSSGKSTFLRVFPLLRQSVETRTLSGLLLNEGDVNFGFFPDAVHRDAEPAELRLEFGFQLRQGDHRGLTANRFLLHPINVCCEICYSRRTKDQRYPALRALRLTLADERGDDILGIDADEDGKVNRFRVNDYEAGSEISQLRLRVSRGIIPRLTRAADETDEAGAGFEDEAPEIGVFEKLLLEVTKDLFHGLTGNKTRLETLRSFRIGSQSKMLTVAKSSKGGSFLAQRVKDWNIDTLEFRKIRNLVVANNTSEILHAINNYVTQLAGSVQYFQPVRARVLRDYLSRDVQVGSVDPSGENVAMVLASLAPSALADFRGWTRSHFDLEVYPQSVGDGARISLRMKEGFSDSEFNLADTGFGFSQILPFLLQIWKATEHEPKQRSHRWRYRVPMNQQAFPQSILVAIEQPELHLHPALQARLADLFVSVAHLSRERQLPVRFVLETHSSAIVERIGALIEAKAIGTDDVQVLLFERSRHDGDTNTAMVRTSSFDADGVLQDWPFGFLSPPPITIPSSQPTSLAASSAQ